MNIFLIIRIWENKCTIKFNTQSAKDPYEAKYQYLINKREKVGLDHFKYPRAFIEYSNDMQDVYKNIED